MRIALTGPAQLDILAPLVDRPLPTSGGSAAVMISRLATGLHARGHEVSVVTTAAVGEPLVARGDRLTVHVGINRPRHRARDVFAAERASLRAGLEGANPQVVHAHWTYEFALAALATGLPTLVTVRDWAPTVLRHHPHPYRLVRLGMAVTVLARARELTAVSPEIARLLRRWARRDADVIPNAFDDAAFVPPDEVAGRQPRRPPSIVAVNNGWGSRKNVNTLLQALPVVRDRVPGTRLQLIGVGYGPGESAHRYAHEHGLDDGVEFVGALPHDRAMARLAGADLLVHPSLEESFGSVLVEAMARGVPVVAGRDSGAVPWVCDDGRAGVLTDVTSPGALAEAIVSLLDDPQRARSLALAAHRSARIRFGLDQVLDRYEAHYRRLAAA